MKKIFLLIAFAGIVGASSSAAIITFKKGTADTFRQDEKKKGCCKKDANHDCTKHAKGECKKEHDCSKHEKGKCHKEMSDSTKKECSKKDRHGKKDCCKKGATPATPPTK